MDSNDFANKILNNYNKVYDSESDKMKSNNIDGKFNIIEPKTTFSDIVLSKDVYSQIMNSLDNIKLNKIFRKMNPELFDDRNYLAYNLFGKSGTGKTESAKAIANYYNKKLLMVNYSNLISKYIGETGKNIEEYFKYAQENDLVLFFDEADTLVANRLNGDNNNSSDTNIFMQNLDNYSGIIILTTNKFKDYDKAMMRRFINVEYKLPDFEMRKKIIAKKIKNMNYNILSEASEGLSGGQIINALKASYGELAKIAKQENKDLINMRLNEELIQNQLQNV